MPRELLAIKLNTIWGFGSKTEVTANPDTIAKAPGATPLAYIAAVPQDTHGDPLAGMRPLNVSNSASSLEASAAGQMVLGYTWAITSPQPGMVELRVLPNGGQNGGSPTMTTTGDPLHPKGVGGGRLTGRGLGYVYPRYEANELLVAVSGGGITVKSNANAGGAIWEWWWRGKEFINDFDDGRQLSMAVYCETGEALQEAGDKYGNPSIPVFARHPSPTLYVAKLGFKSAIHPRHTRGMDPRRAWRRQKPMLSSTQMQY